MERYIKIMRKSLKREQVRRISLGKKFQSLIAEIVKELDYSIL